MTQTLRIGAAQLNPCVGDIAGNLRKAEETYAWAQSHDLDLIVFPELFLLGYPPEDIVLKRAVLDACREVVDSLAKRTAGQNTAILVGSPWAEGGHRYNSVLLLDNGEIVHRYDKRELPNYGVFDEIRVFHRGSSDPVIDFRGARLGLAICEDIWLNAVPSLVADKGADLMIVPNGSPWRRGIQSERLAAFANWSELRLPYIFVNQVGGQDELVFDGASFVKNRAGETVFQAPEFEEHLSISEWYKTADGWTVSQGEITLLLSELEAEYRAAMMALGDYVNKNGFPGVVIGLSGGIDSALTAALAVDALGADRVWCVMMPSRYTSDESLEDAKACAELLGIRYDIISIAPGVQATDQMLSDVFAETSPDTTEENIQSRLRGLTLMALSNKFGHMVLTTGNKSEMAVGYATLYGDMCGGYNALKDLYKTEVFKLCRWRNTSFPGGALGPDGPVMPERVISKPPSAELREDQKDEDSLPPYDVLDDILHGLIDLEMGAGELVEKGHDPAVVRRIENLLYIAEYKRRQAPPGAKIGAKNFGRDRRYPITNRFRSDRGRD